MIADPASVAYLDYNASAPLRPEARAAMVTALATFGNPSSVHAAGRAARAQIESSREAVAAAVGGDPAGVIWTSGATEANNQALAALPSTACLAAAVEHPSVLALVAPHARIAVGGDGLIDLDDLNRRIAGLPAPFVVAVQLVNNETGVIQPVRAVAERVKARGGLVHCDAVQALGRIPVDLRTLDVDTLAVSAHKIGGPKGVGALVARPGLTIAPMLRGGGQERSRRAGTENVPAIAGFGAAVSSLPRMLADQPRLAAMRDDLEIFIARECPQALIHGRTAPRVANTTCLSLPHRSSEMQLIALDLAGVAVSSGSACSSGKVAASHVLAAMGVSDPHLKGALRISTGWATTAGDLDRFKQAWASLVREQAA
ncbi:MAG: cysteine desulfurase family protein [Rhodospirillaceae bacterium]|nr:cysteine desulfurase family protein [Rhodospirillaceae bacterium]